MAIKSLRIGNFKGIADPVTIPIRPITLFIGENSSGKSTVLHALAALSQTLALPNDQRALILDDEFAYVHLGRFIDVIHSRRYTDSLMLGVNIGTTQIRQRKSDSNTIEAVEAEVEFAFEFKSTRRTQGIFVTAGEIKVGETLYKIRRTSGRMLIENAGRKTTARWPDESGFILRERTLTSKKSFLDFVAFNTAQRAIAKSLRNTFYLGPFRQSPRRNYPTRGASPRQVGPEGDATIPLLANESIQSKSRPHLQQVAAWLQMMGLGSKLGVTRMATSDLFDVSITLPDGKKFSIADLGYGLSQVLPVLTQLSFAPEDSTLLFEQPELHLHPVAQRPLATVFIDAMRKKHLHIVAETHSPWLFGQFQREIRSGQLAIDEIALYRVRRANGKTSVEEIPVDSEGEIYHDWKSGFCD